MGRFDDLVADIDTPQASGGGRFDDLVGDLEPQVAQNKPSAFQRFGGALPVAGSVLGGIAGATTSPVTGPVGPVAGAYLGGAAGEAGRQLLGRALGEETPSTGREAAIKMRNEALFGAGGEITGLGLGRIAKGAYKAFPKAAQAFSGTPAVNVARAQQRGFGVFAPGIARQAAGEAQEKIEAPLIAKLFNTKEQVKIQAKDAGFANQLWNSVLKKQIEGKAITLKEAVGLRNLGSVIRAADTARGVKKNINLDKALSAARAVIAEQSPQLTKGLGDTERAITASQLRKPLRVNKTNPDQISGLTTTLGPMLGIPALAATIPISPLAMGIYGAGMGTIKRRIPALLRRAIQRGVVQSGTRLLGQQEE